MATNLENFLTARLVTYTVIRPDGTYISTHFFDGHQVTPHEFQELADRSFDRYLDYLDTLPDQSYLDERLAAHGL